MRENKNKKFETLEAEWDFLNGGGCRILSVPSNIFAFRIFAGTAPEYVNFDVRISQLVLEEE